MCALVKAERGRFLPQSSRQDQILSQPKIQSHVCLVAAAAAAAADADVHLFQLGDAGVRAGDTLT